MNQPALPVLYLNPLTHQGETFIKCWHQSSPAIRQRLKVAPWMKYSKTYQCYVMRHTAQFLEQTFRHFTGIATVNTRYLYRPQRLRPAEGAVLLAGVTFGRAPGKSSGAAGSPAGSLGLPG